MSWPVVKAAPGELSQSTALAISSGIPMRPTGVCDAIVLRKADMAAGRGVIDDRTTTRPKDGGDFVLQGEQYAADVDVAYLMVVL